MEVCICVPLGIIYCVLRICVPLGIIYCVQTFFIKLPFIRSKLTSHLCERVLVYARFVCFNRRLTVNLPVLKFR